MTTYELKTGGDPDFMVRYEINDGRGEVLQGIRWDFKYATETFVPDSVWMIWPQFLDNDDNPLPEGSSVPRSGRASMWILDPELRGNIHQSRIKVGTRGYFMEGKIVGDVVVGEILGLHDNPISK